MKLLVDENDDFESNYLTKFKAEAQRYGLFVNYEKDRVGIDIGLHLTKKLDSKNKRATQSRVWFQLKGKKADTLSLEEYKQCEFIELKGISIEHLKFWYASPEAVYMAVYIESANIFIIEDVRSVVLRRWGEQLFEESTFKPKQATTTIKVRKANESSSAVWERMYFHSSIRTDGPSYKGRPLGHRLDPLRCIPKQFETEDFEKLVLRLLEVHSFKEEAILPSSVLFKPHHGQVKIIKGILRQTYEWRPQIGTVFGYTSANVEQAEGVESQLETVQGRCLVIIHSEPVAEPDSELIDRLSTDLIEEEIKEVIFFVNRGFGVGEYGLKGMSYFGAIHRKFRKHGIHGSPQFLGDLAFNVLIATNVYLEFRDIIQWKIVNYLRNDSST